MRAYVYFYTRLPVFFKNGIISSILFSLKNRGITSAVFWLRYYHNYYFSIANIMQRVLRCQSIAQNYPSFFRFINKKRKLAVCKCTNGCTR